LLINLFIEKNCLPNVFADYFVLVTELTDEELKMKRKLEVTVKGKVAELNRKKKNRLVSNFTAATRNERVLVVGHHLIRTSHYCCKPLLTSQHMYVRLMIAAAPKACDQSRH